MNGEFKLANEVITFSRLSFQVPGANVNLAGDYDLDRSTLRFSRCAKAAGDGFADHDRVETLGPETCGSVLCKQGAGTFLRIKVEGSSKEPKFGLDRGPSEAEKKKGVQGGKPAA